MKFIQSILFSLLLCATIMLPVYADDNIDDDNVRDKTPVYSVYNDVDLIPTVTYRYNTNPKITVKSVYPQLESDNDSDGIDSFNQSVKDSIDSEIDAFKNQVMQNQDTQKNLPKSLKKNSLNIDYNAAAITAGSDHLISIRFSAQAYIGGMAHPSHQYWVINYNLDKNQKIEFNDLFKPDTDYLSVLSELARDSLMKHLSNQEMINEGTTPKPENYKNWNLKPSGLLITFEEGRVAPYVNGAQTVLIPYSALKAILSPESPLARCIRKKYCVQNNLLTGGFIDEA